MLFILAASKFQPQELRGSRIELGHVVDVSACHWGLGIEARVAEAAMVLGVKSRRLAMARTRMCRSYSQDLKPVVSHALKEINEQRRNNRTVSIKWLKRNLRAKVKLLKATGAMCSFCPGARFSGSQRQF